MIFAIVFGIVLVPFFFVLIYKAKAKVQHKIKKTDDNIANEF